MNDFFRKFLLDDGKRLNLINGRQVFLAAFGKHPGWDDHIEDIGLETESLIFAKKIIYLEGIGGAVDGGAWEKLDPNHLLPGFQHLFVWQRSRQILVGRLWSSSDGKGRTRYPMIVCVHGIGLPLEWMVKQVLPRLEAIESASLATKSAADVQAMMGRVLQELRQIVANLPAEVFTGEAVHAQNEAFLSWPEWGPDHQGLLRILYQMRNQWSAYAGRKPLSRNDPSVPRPQQIRVPWVVNSPDQVIQAWSLFFRLQLAADVPLLFILPGEQPWLDVLVGEPSTHELFCLRASSRAIPETNTIPYTLDAAIKQSGAQLIDAIHRGEATLTSEEDRPSHHTGRFTRGADTLASTEPSAPRRRWKWFGWGGLIVGLVVAAGFLLPAPSPREKSANPPPPVGPSTKGITSENKPQVQTTPNAAEEAQLAKETKAEEKRRAELRAKTIAEANAREKARITAEIEAKAKTVTQSAEVKGPAPETSKSPSASPPASPAAGPSDSFTNSIGMVLIQIPKLPGAGEGGGWVGKFEVTQEEYSKVMGENPSEHKGSKRLPVERVSWVKAHEFCGTLTHMDQKGGLLSTNSYYTLPTTEQWRHFVGDAQTNRALAVLDTNATVEVGSRSANEYGLFDVNGNVMEWTLDKNGNQFQAVGADFSSSSLSTKFLIQSPTNDSANVIGFRCLLVRQH